MEISACDYCIFWPLVMSHTTIERSTQRRSEALTPKLETETKTKDGVYTVRIERNPTRN